MFIFALVILAILFPSSSDAISHAAICGGVLLRLLQGELFLGSPGALGTPTAAQAEMMQAACIMRGENWVWDWDSRNFGQKAGEAFGLFERRLPQAVEPFQDWAHCINPHRVGRRNAASFASTLKSIRGEVCFTPWLAGEDFLSPREWLVAVFRGRAVASFSHDCFSTIGEYSEGRRIEDYESPGSPDRVEGWCVPNDMEFIGWHTNCLRVYEALQEAGEEVTWTSPMGMDSVRFTRQSPYETWRTRCSWWRGDKQRLSKKLPKPLWWMTGKWWKLQSLILEMEEDEWLEVQEDFELGRR